MAVSRDFTNRLTWEEKARKNPLWAVMSVDEFAGADGEPASWTPEQLALFFGKGRSLFEIFIRPALLRAGLVPGQAFVLEYGSGMGRVLKAVHDAGYRCAGVDISETMLRHSRRLVPEVDELYALPSDGRIPVADGSVDYVYSYAVLQHIERRGLVRKAVGEMCRVLKRGGLIRLQFQPGSMPFGGRLHGVTHAVNLEHRSLVFRWVDLRRRWSVPAWIPPLPVVLLQRHNHWSGVPLSWRTMRHFLKEGGVRLLSLERDATAEWNSVWLLGRKG